MSHPERPSPSRPKATWLCPECGHESSVWGDWEVTTRGDEVRTSCPECGTTIDERPRRNRSAWDEAMATLSQVREAMMAAPALVLGIVALQLQWLNDRA
jgi:predicted RNA-binding Zn-ribbon protein involved in translation (DUF1610 family)